MAERTWSFQSVALSANESHSLSCMVDCRVLHLRDGILEIHFYLETCQNDGYKGIELRSGD